MLSDEHTQLVRLIETLSAEQASEVLTFTQTLLRQQAPAQRPINESFNWTAEDIEDFSRAGMDYANKTIPWDDDIPYDESKQS